MRVDNVNMHPGPGASIACCEAGVEVPSTIQRGCRADRGDVSMLTFVIGRLKRAECIDGISRLFSIIGCISVASNC